MELPRLCAAAHSRGHSILRIGNAGVSARQNLRLVAAASERFRRRDDGSRSVRTDACNHSGPVVREPRFEPDETPPPGRNERSRVCRPDRCLPTARRVRRAIATAGHGNSSVWRDDR